MSIQINTINSGESGAVVRAKINSLFLELIAGAEGINKVWSQIRELAKSTETLGENLEEIDQKAVKTTQDLVAYTNKEVYGLLQYINALKSNTPGLIPDTSYNPQVALEDSAAFIAVGPGTFTHFKDSSNQPITISEDSAINIFYKAAGVSYYTYKGFVVPSPSAGYQLMGVATIDTNPGTPDAKVFYIANGKGTYTNFGGLEVTEDEVVVLYWDTSWHKVSTGIASNDKLTELESELGFKESLSWNGQGYSFTKAELLKSGNTVIVSGESFPVDLQVYAYYYENGESKYTVLGVLSNSNKSITATLDRDCYRIYFYSASSNEFAVEILIGNEDSVFNGLHDNSLAIAQVDEKVNELKENVGYVVIDGVYNGYEVISDKILLVKGTVVKNNGIPILIASDDSLTNRHDLETGEIYTLEHDINFFKSIKEGRANLYVVGNAQIYESNIADGAISESKLAKELTDSIYFETSGKNLLAIDNNTKGQMLSSSGDLIEVSGPYAVSKLIKVEANSDYYYSAIENNGVVYAGGSGYVAYIGIDGKTIVGTSNSKNIHTTSDTQYIKASIYLLPESAMLNKGSVRGEFLPITRSVDEEQKARIDRYIQANKVDCYSFDKLPKNLFDKYNVVNGYIGSGILNSNDTYRTTGYIPVEAGRTYYFSNVRFVECFDSGKNYINLTFDTPVSLICDENTSYIRVSCYGNNLDKAMVCPDELPSEYMPCIVNTPYIDKTISENNFLDIKPSVNLFIEYRSVSGYLSGNGTVSSNDVYNTTEYIRVLPGTMYCFAFARFIEEYDADYNPITESYVDKAFAAESNITTSYNTSYIRVTFQKVDNYKAVISKDILPTRYVSGNVFVPFLDTKKSKFFGKNMVCFGDSITGSVDERDNYNWCMQLDEILGINTINQGYWSGKVAHAQGNEPVKEAFSLFNLVDAIVSKDWSKQQIIYETEGYEQHAAQIDKLKTVDFSKIDYVSIALGTNDLASNTPFEIEEEPFSVNSVNGAFRYCIKKMLDNYPHLKFLIMTPIYRFNPATGEDVIVGGRGIQDFVDDYLELGKELRIPVVNMFNEIGVNKWNREYYWGKNGGDGLHPNTYMKILMGQKVAGALNSLY